MDRVTAKNLSFIYNPIRYHVTRQSNRKMCLVFCLDFGVAWDENASAKYRSRFFYMLKFNFSFWSHNVQMLTQFEWHNLKAEKLYSKKNPFKLLSGVDKALHIPVKMYHDSVYPFWIYTIIYSSMDSHLPCTHFSGSIENAERHIIRNVNVPF